MIQSYAYGHPVLRIMSSHSLRHVIPSSETGSQPFGEKGLYTLRALITPFIFLLSRQKKNETKRRGDFFQSLRGKKWLYAVLTCTAHRHGAGFLPIGATILRYRLLG